jgi:translation initiation factor 2A
MPQVNTSHPPAAAVADALLSPGSQNPASKKLRGLQKKIRAIEDLEMRLAGGEKLEDTQMKKIATKSSVVKELETIEKDPNAV